MTTTSLRVRVGCEFVYETVGETPAVVLVRPESVGHRVRSESWSTAPEVPYHDFGDLHGNRARRLTLPAGRVSMRYDAEGDISPEPAETNLAARERRGVEVTEGVLADIGH